MQDFAMASLQGDRTQNSASYPSISCEHSENDLNIDSVLEELLLDLMTANEDSSIPTLAENSVQFVIAPQSRTAKSEDLIKHLPVPMIYLRSSGKDGKAIRGLTDHDLNLRMAYRSEFNRAIGSEAYL
jgi:hypothetical protein